jgi:hypothetical protein
MMTVLHDLLALNLDVAHWLFEIEGGVIGLVIGALWHRAWQRKHDRTHHHTDGRLSERQPFDWSDWYLKYDARRVLAVPAGTPPEQLAAPDDGRPGGARLQHAHGPHRHGHDGLPAHTHQTKYQLRPDSTAERLQTGWHTPAVWDVDDDQARWGLSDAGVDADAFTKALTSAAQADMVRWEQ